MTGKPYHVVSPGQYFARANRQTISQRAHILWELGYRRPTIAEICCGDCQRQQKAYREMLQTETYCGLDISPAWWRETGSMGWLVCKGMPWM
jgi:hypothetical protein